MSGQRLQMKDLESVIGTPNEDTIIGKKRYQAILTLVDRQSRFTILTKVERRTSDNVRNAIIDLLKPMIEKVKTITANTGKEFAGHEKVAKK